MSIQSRPDQEPPLSSSTILLSGITLYAIAYTKPEVLLLLSILFAKFIPYAYRVNDEATERRKLWKEFDSGENRPQDWKNVTFNNTPESFGVMKEEYWVNKRLVF